jgi:hypothetical protein
MEQTFTVYAQDCPFRLTSDILMNLLTVKAYDMFRPWLPRGLELGSTQWATSQAALRLILCKSHVITQLK